MTRWNPNDPSVIGAEFFGSYGAPLVPHQYAPLAQQFRSNATETIAALRLHAGITVVGGGPAAYLAEIVAAGDEVPAGFSVVTYAPNVLTVVAGNVNNGGLGPPSVSAIDEWPPNYSDVVSMGPNASFNLEFASASFAPLGRIAAVAVEVVTPWGISTWGTATDAVRRTVVSVLNGGTLYGSAARIVPNNNAAQTAGRYLFSWGEINPVTGQPWTEADVEQFDTGNYRVRVARQTGDGGAWATAAIRLAVAYENTERRVARGVLSAAAASDPVWSADVALASPAGVANWAKANAVDYTLIVRQADQGTLTPFGANSLDVSTIQACAGAAAPPDLPCYLATVETVTYLTDNSVTLAAPNPAAWAEIPGRLLAFVLRTSAPATSADGQPYSDVRRTQVYNGSGNTRGGIVSSTGDDYAGLRLTVGADVGATPTQSLTVGVRRTSDDVLMGTFTVTADDLPASDGSLYCVEVKAPGPITLAAGVAYYLDFRSLTTSSAPWRVGLLAVVALGGGMLYEEATYGGGTLAADPIRGSVASALVYTPADFAAVLDAAVDTPADFTASAEVQPLTDPPSSCALTGIPYALLEWSPVSLGTDFAAYRLQREHPTLGWQDIGYLTDQTQGAFRDFEARLGVPECYRIRSERTDGATSYWSDEECATLDGAGCGYTFTSNEAPDDGVAYADVHDPRSSGAERDYGFPEADEVQYRTMYLRPFQVGFHPLERRGVTFTRRLLVAMLAAGQGPGPAAFDALRDLAWAGLSYVTVRDEAGNRWFGTIAVPDGSAIQHAGAHRATLRFVEGTATPSTPDQPAPPGPATPLTFVSGDPFGLVEGGTLDLVT